MEDETSELKPIIVGDIFQDMTLRERKVCALTVQGMNTKEVAMSLGISHRTVEDYRMGILRKTGLKTMIQVAFRLFGEPKVVA